MCPLRCLLRPGLDTTPEEASCGAAPGCGQNQPLEDSMNKAIVLSFALLGASAAWASTAMAFNVDEMHSVYLIYGGEEILVGTWQCDEARAVEQACRYECQWSSATSSSKARLVLDEI